MEHLMTLRVHHLNCGSMREIEPNDGPLSPLRPARAVCHCLLIETPTSGLVLIETGLGSAAIERPQEVLGDEFLGRAQPVLDVQETAARQVDRLGHSPDDVRHIVLTHLDLDHAGGLPDFPHAQVHVHDAEHRAAMAAPGVHPEDRVRYRPSQWAHRPRWVTYASHQGDAWFGFDAVRQLEGLPADILLIPLAGHTRGHTAVAVQLSRADRDVERPPWLLHAGDAYYYHGEIDPEHPRSHPGMDLLQAITEVDRPLRLGNLARLRDLVRFHGDEVEVVSAHDPWELQHHEERMTAIEPSA
jgi:glyoxylase-like metal-dependent hydrolase (beta-lactamase superfamily II)